MKHLLSLSAAFVALVDARVLPQPSWPHLSALDVDFSRITTASYPNVTIAAADLWQEAINRGAKLKTGTKSDDATAATLYGFPTNTAESPFDGSLVEELREWGYNDNTPAMQLLHDKECNMASASGHMLSKTFADLSMGTASKRTGGSNECFQIEHYSGPAVIKNEDGILPDKREQYYSTCGTTYLATGAEYTLGVNAAGCALFALNRVSSPKAARELWRRRPEAVELPHLRSASDIAWAA
ncbi:Mitochondrial import inner membrane translocase subunit tim8 [Didymella pomorum]